MGKKRKAGLAASWLFCIFLIFSGCAATTSSQTANLTKSQNAPQSYSTAAVSTPLTSLAPSQTPTPSPSATLSRVPRVFLFILDLTLATQGLCTFYPLTYPLHYFIDFYSIPYVCSTT